MLNRLVYSVSFENPARNLQADIEFKEGHTGITGRNGKGKSMILEMIQFCLFGTVALRGKADDYKKLKAELSFTVKEVGYVVTRSGNTVRLFIAGEQIATGTKPVNARILEIFSYSYDVFRIANVANQGAIEELGNMKPMERKRMVDETIGLNVLDEVAQFITNSSKDLVGEIRTLESVATAPVPPSFDASLQSVEDYQADEKRFREILTAHAVLQAAANKVLDPLDKAPEAHPQNSELEGMQAVMKMREVVRQELELSKRQLAAIPAPVPMIALHPLDGKLESLKEDLENYRRLEAQSKILQQQVRTVPTPLTMEEIEAERAILALYSRWLQRQQLVEQRIPHDCPACKHHWDDEDPRIASEFGDLTDEAPGLPVFTPENLQKMEKNLEIQARTEQFLAQISTLEEQMTLIPAQTLEQRIKEIETARKGHAASEAERGRVVEREKYSHQVETLTKAFNEAPDHRDTINAIIVYRRAYETWEVMNTILTKAHAERDSAIEHLKAFHPDLNSQYEKAQEHLLKAIRQEQEQKQYAKSLEHYNVINERLKIAKAQYADWMNGRAAIADLRVMVKGYLLPSLNSVASTLINQMTGGELSWITVNDEFEITVEGQRLETLSGAGKAVANLALRIALGQVLCGRVFSVMLLDEIDASMDEDRAQYVSECLRNLTKTVKQVIQVSHKPGLQTEHMVQL